MSDYIRAILLIGSSVNFIFVCLKLRKSRLKIMSAFFWIVFSLVLLLLGAFPQIGIFFANLLGIMSPINFIYLVMIFLLILNSFLLTLRISEVEFKLTELVEELAVREYTKN